MTKGSKNTGLEEMKPEIRLRGLLDLPNKVIDFIASRGNEVYKSLD